MQASAHRAGLAREREERRLEGVLGVGLVAEDAQRRGPDGVGVPAHEQLERGGVAGVDEPAQQFARRGRGPPPAPRRRTVERDTGAT